MLRTNLATRPFYNERLAAVLVWSLAALVIAVTAVSAVKLWSEWGRDAALRSEASRLESQAADLRRQAQAARGKVDAAHVREVAGAAREANALIDGRTFSWTELFNRFEATLPPGVRIASVRPTRGDRGQFIVTISVVARDIGEIDAFMEALEARGGFRDVLARREAVDYEGRIDATISGVYTGRVPAEPASGADEEASS